MNIKALRQRKADETAKARKILDAAAASTGGVLTAEQQAELDKIKANIAEIDATLSRAEEFADIEREMAGARSADDDAPASGAKKRSGPFASIGEQMVAIIGSATSGSIDPRLMQVEGAASGLNESNGADGGFLVQTEFTDEVLRRGYSESQLASRVRRITSSSGANAININGVEETSRVNGSRFGGIRLYWEGEAHQYTGARPKFDQVGLKLKKLTGLCYLTDELMEDAAALSSLIDGWFGEEFGIVLDTAYFEGDGAGKPLGITKSGALVTQTKVSGQAAGTIVAGNIGDMWARMPVRNRRNAVWLASTTAEGKLPGMTIGNQPVYLPPGGLTANPYGMLQGRPVIPMEQCEEAGTKNDILLVDPSQYIAYDKGQMQKAVSLHVRFLEGEQVLRFTYRVDGQPAWKSALTPMKGTATLSPFITLETRSGG